MGSWGVKAYENDTAADWVFDKIKKEVEKALYSPYSEPEEVLAALAVAVDLGLVPWLAWEDVEKGLARVKFDDEKTEWKTPKERAAYLKSLRERLRRGRKDKAAWSPLGLVLKARPKRGTKTTKPTSRKPSKTVKGASKKKVSA